jgi:uncharacterized protein (UPF0179 family)
MVGRDPRQENNLALNGIRTAKEGAEFKILGPCRKCRVFLVVLHVLL